MNSWIPAFAGITINFKGEMMKKAVITILGLAGGKVEKKDEKMIATNFQDKQKYYFEKNNTNDIQEEYTNTLPLLMDKYKEPHYTIIPIFTKEAKLLQTKLLKENENKSDTNFFNDDYLINDDNDFEAILNTINSALSITKYDKFIIDLTHGFRHLPILATISLIMKNISYPKKIEHIWFAQEKIKPEKKEGDKPKVQGEYHVIDLKDYLDLANLSYMLSMFNQNYTISNQMTFSKDEYTKLSKELKTFSEHFLANSLKPLIEGTVSKNIIEKLTTLKEDEKVNNFSDDIDKIIGHIKSIQQLKDEKNEWMKLYTLSKIMCDGGYMLNAITLLFEAIGFYCANSLSTISETTKKHIIFFKTDIIDKKEPKSKYSTYTLVNQSRNFVKLVSEFSGEYLYNPQTIDWSEGDLKKKKPKPKDKLEAIQREIKTYLGSLDIRDFQNFIREMEALRNNLAHGNSGESLVDAKEVYDKNLKKFEKFCINDNILQK